jgi:hypothetical protein
MSQRSGYMPYSMNENHLLWETLSAYRKKDPAEFEKAVGYLLPDGLEAAFERLEGSSLTPQQIRNSRNPSPEDEAKLVAFYAIVQARNICYWDEKERKSLEGQIIPGNIVDESSDDDEEYDEEFED